MFKFDEIEKEEREKKVLRDWHKRVALMHVTEFARELERMIEPMRIYFPNAEVLLDESGLGVTLDLKYRNVQGEQQIFRLELRVEHDQYSVHPNGIIVHGSPTTAAVKHRFYSQHGKSIEEVFRMRMLQSLEDD